MLEFPSNGSCEEKENQKLFASQYLEDFDQEGFLLDHPEIDSDTKEGATAVRQARVEHQRRSALTVVMAQKVCAECPVLASCSQAALSANDPTEIYGVVGGMTMATRKAQQGKTQLSVKDIFASDPQNSAAASLMAKYSVKSSETA